jgi:hypothetical protein
MITGRTELLKALGVSRSNIGLGIALGVSVQENLMLSAMGVLQNSGVPVPPSGPVDGDVIWGGLPSDQPATVYWGGLPSDAPSTVYWGGNP